MAGKAPVIDCAAAMGIIVTINPARVPRLV
jgi:hypothetical protein